MVIKREVAYGIVRGLTEFWKSEELQDFTVTVGSIQFVCHRVILASCSGFFQGLFRSQMKENICKCATVEGMSSDTFALILEVMYTGHGVLTNDNVIDIWHAANQLQITFLMDECEAYVNRSLSLENFEKYLYHAKLLNRKNVLETLWNFVQSNFDLFSQTDTLLDLSVNELLNLVKSQDLKVTSEDLVVRSILRWADQDSSSEHFFSDHRSVYERNMKEISGADGKETKSSDHEVHNVALTPDLDITSELRDRNPDEDRINKEEVKLSKEMDKLATEANKKRSDYLDTLLSAARTCLVSSECLEQTMKLPMIMTNMNARDIILKAVFYKIHRGHRHGQWPSSAIRRNFAESEHVAITCVSDSSQCLTELSAFSFVKTKWFKISPFPNKLYKTICLNIDNTLNVYGTNDGDNLHCSLQSSNTFNGNLLGSFPNKCFLAEIIDNFVYIMTSTDHEFFSVNTSTNTLLKMNTDFKTNSSIQHLTTFSNYLLIFYSEPINADKKETAVQCFNTLTKTFKRLNNLEGPAEKMTSFRNDHNTFVLQTNGDLWKVVQSQSDVVDFEFVAKLWSCDWPLHGAVTYLDDLYIYGAKSDSLQTDPCLKKNLSDFFHHIIYLESDISNCSGFVPAVVPRKMLLPK